LTALLEPAKALLELGFSLVATRGTARYLREQGLEVAEINKVLEGQPHVVDAIIDGEVKLVLNTTAGKKAIEDSFSLRRAALNRSVPYYTTVAGIRAAAFAMKAVAKGGLEVASLQSYFKDAS